MKVQTLSSLVQNVFLLLTIPVFAIILIDMLMYKYGWEHYYRTTFCLTSSIIAVFAYFIWLNVQAKSLKHLYQTFKNNRKYKSLVKLNLDTEEQNVFEQKQPIQNISKIHKNKYQRQKQQNDKNLNNLARLFKKGRQINYSHRKQKKQQKTIHPIKYHIEESFIIPEQKQPIQRQIAKEKSDQFAKYQESLIDFKIKKQFVSNLINQTKQIVKQKIDQHIISQLKNLEQLQNIVNTNYEVNFRSFKHKNTIKNNLYRNKTRRINHQQHNNLEISFGQMLKQINKLTTTNYIDFELKSNQTNRVQVINQIKALLFERIQLDKYLSLKMPLYLSNIRQNLATNKSQQYKIQQFQQQRYLQLQKLQKLVQILNQRQDRQQELLAKYFMTQKSQFQQSQNIQNKINSKSNIDLVIGFIVLTFNKKIQQIDNQRYLHVTLSKPNLYDQEKSYIWLRRNKSLDAMVNYKIVYSKMQITNPDESNFKHKKQQKVVKQAVCPPNQNHIWITILFVRFLIAEIGLKPIQYSMIKSKKLRQQVHRIVDLLK